MTNNLPDFWNMYYEAERFLETLPQTNNTLDIYDKIYRDREEEKLAEFYGYNDYDMDDLNNNEFLDEYNFNEYDNYSDDDISNAEYTDESDDDNFQ